ncbi:MAG: DUF2203 family protein [Methanobacteriota archaeon]|nr:MAG: DUF2203 family protein [Euryarchaeota archaeon]
MGSRMGAPYIPANPAGVPTVELPTKVFTVQQADRLLPALEAILHEMDHRSLRLREVLELVQDAEEYWGAVIADPDVRGREKYAELLRERDDLEASLQGDIERVTALGAVLKDYQQGLVDFYGYIEGRLVFLCWQRGEPAVRFYHPLEGGFAGRRPIAPVPQD